MNSGNSRWNFDISTLLLYAQFLWKEIQNDQIRTEGGVAFQRSFKFTELQGFKAEF